MKEYTLLACVAAVAVLWLDRGLGVRALGRSLFWKFLAVIFCFKLLVNGYLTWRPIVIYNPEMMLNIRLLTIPVEDFLYGFALVAGSVILWEHFLRGKS